jgi:ATP-dependent DNA helicase RecG
MLFSPYPQTHFPQLCITAVVVPGEEMGVSGPNGKRFLDNRRFTGPIPEMVRDACDFVARNTRTATAFDDLGRRADRPEYPPQAVREAVLNAVVHRDYGPFGDTVPVRIEIYPDRLEIRNEGGLYGRTDVESLGFVRPDTRNMALADMMEILRETENRYSGIPTIRAECKAAGLPPPVFSSRRGTFLVTFSAARTLSEVSFSRVEPFKSLLEFCRTPRSRDELASFAGMSRFYVMSRFVAPLLADGRLKETIPERPKSKNQRYVTGLG